MVSRIRGTLEVKFTNGIVQTLDLEAELLRGFLNITPLDFNFGSAHISPGDDFQNPLDILLSNPSRTEAQWQIEHWPFVRKPRARYLFALFMF